MDNKDGSFERGIHVQSKMELSRLRKLKPGSALERIREHKRKQLHIQQLIAQGLGNARQPFTLMDYRDNNKQICRASMQPLEAAAHNRRLSGSGYAWARAGSLAP